MAAPPQRQASSPSDLRDLLVPWLAAALAGALAVRRFVRGRAWPALVVVTTTTARGIWRATGATTEAVARSAPTLLRVAAAGVDRLDHMVVPLLTAAGRATAAALGWWVHGLATALLAGARLVPRGLDAVERRTVPALQALGASSARRTWAGTLAAVRLTRRHGPRLALGSAVGAGGLVAIAAAAFALSGPALQLASALVVPDLSAGEGLPALDERSVVYAADGSTLAILNREVDRRVVPLDQIPPHVRQAVIAAEDRRFPQHAGYDLEAIGRALKANLRAGSVTQGGSTITQQIAKQTFTDGDRTVSRKARELLHAVALERHLDKDELLERYLNQVYFGSGAYGVAAAAEELFGVLPEALTVEQAALLAGLIRSPGTLDPRGEPERALARRNQVLSVMADEGYLTPAEHEAATATSLGLVDRRQRAVKEPHVVEAVKRELLADPSFGDTREARAQRLLTGGLRIHTTIDPELQEHARAAAEAHTSGEGPTAALAAVDPRDGAVRALHGGADFADEQFDVATQGRRQPGSAFKPFVAAAALELGVPPSQVLAGDSPLELELGDGEQWRVRNHGDADFGPVDLDKAMAASVNTAFAELVLDTGVDPVVDLAARLGIDVDRALGGSRGPAIALGGLAHGVSPLEMASAYGAFATLGTHVEPRLVARVTDADGTPVSRRPALRTQAMDADTATQVRHMLEGVVEQGTGTAAAVPGWPVAGKTGTTQEQADAWFVGTTPALSTAVWVGHADARRPVAGLTGGGTPARIWRDFTQIALAGEQPESFPDAEVETGAAR